MKEKRTIELELNPYDAILILSFCREFVNDDTCDEYKFKALKDAVDDYEIKLGEVLSDEDWEEIHQKTEINSIIGKTPPKR